MPLIVMVGFPSSGKSSAVSQISKFIQNIKGKNIHIVSEEDFIKENKNQVLDDSRKEKELRAMIKSEAQRILSKDNFVIIDSLNYIKGYRYELYCMSKAVPTRQVTIECEISVEDAWSWNCSRPIEEQYKKDVFDHLIERYEAPDSSNRWDSPYFSIIPNEPIDFESIFNSLISSKQPKQNQSTQSKPISESGFLTSLEKITSDIIQSLGEEIKNSGGGEIKVPNSSILVKSPENLSTAQLNRLKRQFINLTKSQNLKSGEANIGDMFAQYLNSQSQL